MEEHSEAAPTLTAIKLLLSHGADATVRGESGHTAAELAKDMGKGKCAALIHLDTQRRHRTTLERTMALSRPAFLRTVPGEKGAAYEAKATGGGDSLLVCE